MTETFLERGASLTHHHAVGLEHRAWLEREVSPTGASAIRALKSGLDPKGVLNPGKLILDAKPPERGALEPAPASGSPA